MKLCDLHTHSVFSDGTCTPAELIRAAEQIGLRAIALTDHNTIAGLPDFLRAGSGSPVEAVPGIEISSEWEGRELHILGLYIQPEHYSAVNGLLAQYNVRKEQSNRKLIENLNRAGLKLSYDEVLASDCGGHINRANIAAVLLKKGYVSDIQDAFRRYLDPKMGCYTPPRRLCSFQVIRFLKSIGAVAVLAHPLLSLDETELRRFLTQQRGCGLDAMETLYVSYDAATTAAAHAIADEFGLKYSGGSDFHGANKPDISLGSGRGNLAVPECVLQNLQE
ncbi:MAG: PHP domain-containing protein [Faecousia sp.]